MPRADSLEKTLLLGKIEGRRRRQQRMRRLDGITDSMDMSLRKLQEKWWTTGKHGMLQSMGLQRVRHDSKRLDHFNYPKGHFLKEIWNRTINFIVSCGPPLTHFCSIKDHSPTGPLCLWLGSAQNEVVLLTIHRSLKSRASCVCFAWQVLAVQR